MQIAIHSATPAQTTSPLLVLGVTSDRFLESKLEKELDKALGGALRAAAKDSDFTGKSKQRLVLHTLGKLRCSRVALLGLGATDKISAADWVNLGASVTRLANEVAAKEALLVLDESPDAQRSALIARGAVLGGYQYTQYKTSEKKKSRPRLSKLLIQAEGAKGKAILQSARHALAVAEAVTLCRDLVNESPLQLYPETFAQKAAKVAKTHGLKCRVFTPPQLEKMKMNLLLGVGAGSTRAPRLVHLTYTPPGAAAKHKPIVLVGKGITFDSGGLSLKPGPSMIEMKMDMHGAATVLATMQAIAQLKPKQPVHGLLALAENMPSGAALRPGDVVTGAAGKSVEILNTDAEGRLVLADALHYATTLSPKKIIDFATLTGACMVALGPYTTGLWSNRDELAKSLLESAQRAGEDLWHMPLTEALRSMLDSDVADIKNVGDRFGGAITAALFLKEFVGEHDWAHLDIAGPAMSSKNAGPFTKGGTGVAVATMVDWICG